jgi:CyaY protein
MTDNDYLDKAEAALRSIELSCDRINDELGVDLDSQRNGGMVTLTFANKSQIVVNLQKPLHEIWLAAKPGGFHYRWSDGFWQDTKGRGEFFLSLSEFATLQAGCSLSFTG